MMCFKCNVNVIYHSDIIDGLLNFSNSIGK